LGGETATILLGLASALTWGAADFGGGITSRRAPVLGVALLVQPAGLLAAVSIALLRGEPAPDPGTIGLAMLAGVAGATGLINLYHGLAVGRMGVVAPVTGLLAATLPVVAGIVLQGFPPLAVLAGIGLALVAVVLVARAPGEEGSRTGLEFGLAAGVAIGTLNILISQLPGGTLFGALAVLKVASALFVGLIVVAGRQPWRFRDDVLPFAVIVGALDMAGNALFVLAAQAGRLDVAAVLSSLYPVTTVVLAATVLREPMSRTHLLGIAVAVIAIALIASGSAGT
jgi:drug/metabolite transporter (DMT)-like permease